MSKTTERPSGPIMDQEHNNVGAKITITNKTETEGRSSSHCRGKACSHACHVRESASMSKQHKANPTEFCFVCLDDVHGEEVVEFMLELFF